MPDCQQPREFQWCGPEDDQTLGRFGLPGRRLQSQSRISADFDGPPSECIVRQCQIRGTVGARPMSQSRGQDQSARGVPSADHLTQVRLNLLVQDDQCVQSP